jgi:RNA polymerase sigma-70 factor (ECF subfamily)
MTDPIMADAGRERAIGPAPGPRRRCPGAPDGIMSNPGCGRQQTVMDTTDSALLIAITHGSDDAFGLLVGRHHREVHAACRRQAPPGEADDCVQAVFLVLHRRPDAAGRSPSLLAWLLRVAHHVCRSARRGSRRRRLAEAWASAPAPSGHRPDAALLDHLDAAFDALGERQRAALTLHVIGGAPPTEVAERLGTTQANAYKLIQRGLAELRQRLGRRGVEAVSAAIAIALAPSVQAADPAICVTIAGRRWTPAARTLAGAAIIAMRLRQGLRWLAAAGIALGLGLGSVAALERSPADPPMVQAAETPPAPATAPGPGLALKAVDLYAALTTLVQAMPGLTLVCAVPADLHVSDPGFPGSVDVLLGPEDDVDAACAIIARQLGLVCRREAGVMRFTRPGFPDERLRSITLGQPVPAPVDPQPLLATFATTSGEPPTDMLLALATRCGLAGRRALLQRGPDALPMGMRPPYLPVLLGRGFDPAWGAEVRGALARDPADPMRRAAEAVAAHAADPATWEALVACWRTSSGDDARRLGALVLGAGARGIAVFAEALRAGRLAEGDAIMAIRRCGEPERAFTAFARETIADERLPTAVRAEIISHCFGPWLAADAPLTTAILGLAADSSQPSAVRHAAIAITDSGLKRGDPRLVILADELLHEEAATEAAHWRGLGLRLAYHHAGLPADAPAVRSALDDASPFMRATALAIIADAVRAAGVGEVSLTWPADGSGGGTVVSGDWPGDAAGAQACLRLAAEDPDAAVRKSAAAVGLLMLPANERKAALDRLAERERDPDLLDAYRHEYLLQGTPRRQFLDMGIGFPPWTATDPTTIPDADEGLHRAN